MNNCLQLKKTTLHLHKLLKKRKETG